MPFSQHLEEEPLVPLVVRGIAGRDFARPVDRPSHRLALLLHVGDVLVRPLRGRNALLHRGVLGGEAERIPPHRHQHVVPVHAQVPVHHVVDRVVAHVPHVQVARRVRQHRHAIELGARRRSPPRDRRRVLPLALDVGFDLGGVERSHGFSRRCVPLDPRTVEKDCDPELYRRRVAGLRAGRRATASARRARRRPPRRRRCSARASRAPFSVLRVRTHPFEDHPSPLAEHRNARFRKTTVGENRRLHARDDLPVVQVGVREPASSRLVAARAAFRARMRFGAHLLFGDHRRRLRRTIGNRARHLQERIVEAIGSLLRCERHRCGGRRRGRDERVDAERREQKRRRDADGLERYLRGSRLSDQHDGYIGEQHSERRSEHDSHERRDTSRRARPSRPASCRRSRPRRTRQP